MSVEKTPQTPRRRRIRYVYGGDVGRPDTSGATTDRGRSFWRLWGRALQVAVSLVGPASLLYGALRFAYSHFYDEFGVAPEDVGLDPTSILATSVTALFLCFAAFVLSWFVVLVPTAVLLSLKPQPGVDEVYEKTALLRIKLGTGEMSFLGLNSFQVASVSVIGAVLLWYTPIDIEWKGIAWGGVGLALVVLVIRWGSHRVSWVRKVRERLYERRRSIWAGTALLTVILGMITTYNDLRGLVARYRKKALNREPFSSVTVRIPRIFLFSSVPVLNIRAETAYVAWSGRKPTRVQAGDCLLLLGNSGGISYIYDVRISRMLRVSSTDVITSSKWKTCPPGSKAPKSSS